MRTPASFRFLLTASLPVLAWALVRGAAADTAGPSSPGDTWQVTSQMSMEGMPVAFPARTVKVCSPKVWTEPPGGPDERRKCTDSGFTIEGSKATWKVTCAGPPAMTGEGEITRESADSWSGSIRFASSDGAMTVRLAGRRLGDCENPQ